MSIFAEAWRQVIGVDPIDADWMASLHAHDSSTGVPLRCETCAASTRWVESLSRHHLVTRDARLEQRMKEICWGSTIGPGVA